MSNPPYTCMLAVGMEPGVSYMLNVSCQQSNIPSFLLQNSEGVILLIIALKQGLNSAASGCPSTHCPGAASGAGITACATMLSPSVLF